MWWNSYNFYTTNYFSSFFRTSTILNLFQAASTIAKISAVLGPIIGPVTAAIGIASLFAIFKRAKSQIQALKLFTGGDLSEIISPATRDHGKMNRTQGRNDKYQRDHRIEGSNIEVGGTEYINNAQTSMRYKEFLDRLNGGKLIHIDLNKIGRKTIQNFPL